MALWKSLTCVSLSIHWPSKEINRCFKNIFDSMKGWIFHKVHPTVGRKAWSSRCTRCILRFHLHWLNSHYWFLLPHTRYLSLEMSCSTHLGYRFDVCRADLNAFMYYAILSDRLFEHMYRYGIKWITNFPWTDPNVAQCTLMKKSIAIYSINSFMFAECIICALKMIINEQLRK